MHRSLPSLSALVLPLALVACSAAPPRDAARARALPEYGGRSALLFDDGVDLLPEAHGLASDAETMLRERTLVGGSVLRARVVTLTCRGAGPAGSWAIELHALESVAGDRLPAEDFTLEVPVGARGSSLLADSARGLVGTEVLAFVGAFSRADGSGEVHFHVTGATDPHVRVVRDAVLLAQVR